MVKGPQRWGVLLGRSGVVLAVAGLLALTAIGAARGTAGGARPVSGDWTLFGRTADQNRHSPLTQVTRGNVGELGRVFQVDFRRLDPTIRRGQQSYPLVIDGVMYVTTNDNNVFALNATTGDVRWRYTPPNRAVFNNFGIVANRGVASCAGKLYLLTLDMHIVSLERRTGRVVKRVPIAAAVPGASSNYGYSETSAPICAKNRIVIGAAGSEYGVRGFVMAYHPDLTPAWANPYWTIPPEQQGWRRRGRIVGGGVVWTPTTVDTSTSTLYFGTGSATPLYFRQLRPGRNPRANSIIAVDLITGRQRWWQQQIADNQWAYDTAQPPLVFTGRIGGRTRRIVSVATMEGVWYAYDARTGQPIYQRVKVIDRTEHPSLRPGKPVVVYPSSLGGLNYSPASYDPGTNYILNAAAETAAVLIQKKLTPTEKRRKLVLGDVFLGLENGNFGQYLPGWRDHGSISAIDVNTGRRVWKLRTPEPERGGVTTTAGGLAFAGGGDGVLRALDVRTGRLLWRFQLSHPIASGPTVYAVADKEYVAVTVGGTPTSSNGGTASELHVFSLGGSKEESPPPPRTFSAATVGVAAPAPVVRQTPAPARAAAAPSSGRGGGLAARVVTPGDLYVQGWRPTSSNTPLVTGRLLLRGAPVVGARVRVDTYVLPRLTDSAGRFRYPIDITVARRHHVRVVSVGRATLRGRRLSAPERAAVLRAGGGFSVAYRLSDLRTRVQRNGTVLLTGRATLAGGYPAPSVVLYTYQLRGTVTDAEGKPVEGAVIVTRTLERDFWTFSRPSDSQGRYTSFFPASDQLGSDPVEMNVQVAVGQTSYASPFGRNVRFQRLRSAVMDVRLPAQGPLAAPESSAYPGAVYEGLLVGASGPRGVIRPLSARWPDERGRFALVLPRTARGQTLRVWQNQRQFFSGFEARPGRAVDLRAWPSALPPRVPQGLARLRVGR